MTKTFDPTKGATKAPTLSSVGTLFTWLGTGGDYSSIERKDKALKGWIRKVHPGTMEGRFFVVMATWLTTAAISAYVWKKRSSSKTSKNSV